MNWNISKAVFGGYVAIKKKDDTKTCKFTAEFGLEKSRNVTIAEITEAYSELLREVSA